MKNWFHIQELQKTIDLDLVSEIHWNEEDIYNENATKLLTMVFLGTDGVYDKDMGRIQYTELSLSDDRDRKALYSVVFASEIANCDVPFKLRLNDLELWNP